MKKILIVLVLVFIATLFPSLCHADSSLDGDWKLHERICASYSGQKLCDSDTVYITISDGGIYYEDEYIGEITRPGNNIIFKYDEDYLTTAFEEQIENYGYDMTVEDVSIIYKGTLKNNRIKGTVSGKVVFGYEGYSIPIKYTGNFTAKKE